MTRKSQLNIQSFVESILGDPKRSWSEGPNGERLSTEVIEIRSCPDRGVATYVTTGLSETKLSANGNDSIRMELVFSCHNRWTGVINAILLNVVATSQIQAGTVLYRGETIRPAGPIVEGATVTGFYATTPSHLPGDLTVWDGSDPPTAFAWLIPITNKEWRFIQVHGGQEFEAEIARQQPDLYDLARPSLDLPEPRRHLRTEPSEPELVQGVEDHIVAPTHADILAHLRPILGEPVRQKDWEIEAGDSSFVLRVWGFRDEPVLGAMTFVTSGLSSFLLIRRGGEKGRAELMLSAYEEWADIDLAYLLTSVVQYVLTDSAMPQRGEAITLRHPVVEGGDKAGLLYLEPTYFDYTRFIIRRTTPQTVFYSVIPITGAELQVVRHVGWRKLVDEIANQDPELLDLSRPSIDPGDLLDLDAS